MPDVLLLVALGFFLGIRHATDADHVVAVSTIVSRQRSPLGAAATGLLWGVGHTLTVAAVGAAIILFNLSIPYEVEVGMELSVGVMLILLGLINVAAYFGTRIPFWRGRGMAPRARPAVDTHSHGDYVHTHPHDGASGHHPHPPDRTPLARLDRRFGRSHLYAIARPVVVGVVHGLAGSAAVTLLVVAAVPDPAWAIAYLLVFGLGTIAGMMLITVSLATAIRVAGRGAPGLTRRLGLAAGVASIIFGIGFAYEMWSAAAWPGSR